MDRPKTNSDRINFTGLPDLHGWQWIKAKNTIRQTLENAMKDCDAVVSRVPSMTGYIARQLAKENNKPFLAEVVGDPLDSISHYGKSPLYRVLGAYYYLKFRKFMKQVDFASYVNRRVLGVRYPTRPDAITEEYSSIRLDDDMISHKREYQTSPDPINILCIQSFLGYKRHKDLISACAILKDAEIDFILHLIGDGPEKENISKMVSALGLDSRVVFHGYIGDKKQLIEQTDKCHLVVVPSAQEGLPRSLLEGMARGLGAVGTRIGGIPDIVRPSEIFKLGDIQHLAKILADIAVNPARLTKMSEFSIQTAQNYTASILSPRRIRIYKALAAAAVKDN